MPGISLPSELLGEQPASCHGGSLLSVLVIKLESFVPVLEFLPLSVHVPASIVFRILRFSSCFSVLSSFAVPLSFLIRSCV